MASRILTRVMKHGYSIDKHYNIDEIEPKENPKFKPKVIGKYGIALSPASHDRGILVEEKPMSEVLQEQIRFAQFKQRRASKKSPSDTKIYKRVEKNCVEKLIKYLRSTQFKPHEPYKSIPNWTKNISPEFQEYLKDYRKERLIYLRKKYKEEIKMVKKKKKKKEEVIEKKVKKRTVKRKVVGKKRVPYAQLTEKQKKRRDVYLKSKGEKPKKKAKKGKVIKRKVKKEKVITKRKVTRALPTVDKERYTGLVSKMSTSERKRKREIWRKRLASDSKSTRAKAKVYLSILGGKVSERTKKRKKKGKKIKM